MLRQPISAPRRLGSAATSSKVAELASNRSLKRTFLFCQISGTSAWGTLKKDENNSPEAVPTPGRGAFLASVGLALRTVAIAARVVGDCLITASSALIGMSTR